MTLTARTGFAAQQFYLAGLHARHEPSGISRIVHLYKSEHATPSVRYQKVATPTLLDHYPPQLRHNQEWPSNSRQAGLKMLHAGNQPTSSGIPLDDVSREQALRIGSINAAAARLVWPERWAAAKPRARSGRPDGPRHAAQRRPPALREPRSRHERSGERRAGFGGAGP
jgi:hypothetical protein